MPTLEINNFNIVCSVLGGFITLFGLVSYLFKERFYLSEACKYPFSNCPGYDINQRAVISTLAGVTFSPHATNFIKPMDYAMGSQSNLDAITMYFTRLVLGVQLVIAGVQLPGRYL